VLLTAIVLPINREKAIHLHGQLAAYPESPWIMVYEQCKRADWRGLIVVIMARVFVGAVNVRLVLVELDFLFAVRALHA
jgi:hypothetical protein